MKIARVEAIYLRLPDVNARADGTQDTLIVRVHTGAGLVGLGEVDSSPLVAKAVIEAPLSHATARGLADCVMGQDPLEIDRLWQRMYNGAIFFGRGGDKKQLLPTAPSCLATARPRHIPPPAGRRRFHRRQICATTLSASCPCAPAAR